MKRISMPASSATIGCSIAALRVKVIGLAPCPLVRSQKHPVYSMVLRHRVHRSTSFGTRRVAGEADLGQSSCTVGPVDPTAGLMAHGWRRCRPLPFRIGVKLTKYRCQRPASLCLCQDRKLPAGENSRASHSMTSHMASRRPLAGHDNTRRSSCGNIHYIRRRSLRRIPRKSQGRASRRIRAIPRVSPTNDLSIWCRWSRS